MRYREKQQMLRRERDVERQGALQRRSKRSAFFRHLKCSSSSSTYTTTFIFLYSDALYAIVAAMYENNLENNKISIDLTSLDRWIVDSATVLFTTIDSEGWLNMQPLSTRWAPHSVTSQKRVARCNESRNRRLGTLQSAICCSDN